MKRRFYISHLEPQKIQVLSGSEAHHIEVVLRAKQGEKIILFDGLGNEAAGIIQEIGKGKISVYVEDVHEIEREAGCYIHLGICLPKEKAWDIALKSAVELGVASITPVLSHRSLPLPIPLSSAKLERWNSIIQASCKQCGGNILPELKTLCTLDAFVSAHPEPLKIFGHSQGAPLSEVLKNFQEEEIAVIIGPEGGFDEKEIAWLKEKNVFSASLGKRVLRVETAVTALISRVLFWMEEIQE
jgi:16S rRNA (uracil1498-N3)-methyltransferase